MKGSRLTSLSVPIRSTPELGVHTGMTMIPSDATAMPTDANAMQPASKATIPSKCTANYSSLWNVVHFDGLSFNSSQWKLYSRMKPIQNGSKRIGIMSKGISFSHKVNQSQMKYISKGIKISHKKLFLYFPFYIHS